MFSQTRNWCCYEALVLMKISWSLQASNYALHFKGVFVLLALLSFLMLFIYLSFFLSWVLFSSSVYFPLRIISTPSSSLQGINAFLSCHSLLIPLRRECVLTDIVFHVELGDCSCSSRFETEKQSLWVVLSSCFQLKGDSCRRPSALHSQPGDEARLQAVPDEKSGQQSA